MNPLLPLPPSPRLRVPTLTLLLTLIASALTTLAVAATATAPADPTPQPIFDGKTLSGWEGSATSWRVEDGAITGEIPAGTKLAKNEFIYWTGEVADFELTAEFRISGVPSANSGIQFRSVRHPDGHAVGYQADLDDGAVWLGRIYDEHARALLAERGERVSIAPDGRRWKEKFGEADDYKKLPRPAGEWNTYRILARGPHMELWVNGIRTSVLDDHQPDAAHYSGVIGLQLHSGPGLSKIQFRNILLTQFGRTALPPALAKPAASAAVAPPAAPATVSTSTSGAPAPGSAPAPTAAPVATATFAPIKGKTAIGDFRSNGDPPLHRIADVDDTKRASESPVLWQLRPNPAKPTAIANPAAQKVMSGLYLEDGFQAELIAAEPDLHQPIAFAIDERGRLWVAEAYGYPNRQPEGQGKDRIIILEDKDGDGVFETKKVFAEHLNLVSGLEVGFGGVWVGASPYLLFIPDRNHDDIPDGPPEVLLDGWGYQDTHETLNSFTWGPDGWLYGCHGVFSNSFVGQPGAPDAERTRVHAAVWRYHPVRHEFEVFAAGGSNQWGLDFNSVGALFMTHCRSFYGGGGTSYVIRNGQYWNQANNGYAPYISNHGPDFAPELKNYLLASARYDSGEGGAGKPGSGAIYGGHSHVGTMIYLGDNWPDTYRDHLFTNNLHGHQLNQQFNVRTGSAYETFHAGYDLLFSPDPTYMVVDLQYGPDGSVYMIDWVDIQHCHNPRDELWDRTNGRLYRVSWAETFQPKKVDLAAMTDAQLVGLHTHRNEWFVRTARRLLQERAAQHPLAAAALTALRAQAADATAGEVSQLRALWTLHVTGNLASAQLTAALASPSETIRAWAIQLATDNPHALALNAADLTRLATNDSSSAVRLSVASAAPLIPVAQRWPIVAALAAHAKDAGDRYLPKMTWFATAPAAEADVPRALDLAATTPQPTLADSLRWYAARTAAGREQLTARLVSLPEEAAARALRVMAFALEAEAGLAMPTAWPQVTARFATTKDNAVRGAYEQLSALFGDKAVLVPVRARLANTATPLGERRRALDLLKRAGDTESTALFVRLLDDKDLRAAVIPLLGSAADTATAGAGLIAHFATLNATDRTAALAALTSRPPLALMLLSAVEQGTFDKKALTALHARQLRNLKNAAVTAQLDRVWGKTTDSSANMKATVNRLRQVYRDAPTYAYDAEAGRKVFERTCAACHTLDGAGTGKLGPNLTGTWRNGLDYFLENIVDPNAVVGADYQLNLVTKRDGTVVSGMVDKETDTVLIVRTISDTVNVPKSEIKSRETTPQSMMPPGLLESLPEREALELLKFLTTETK